jgi:XTP/dITP diphosphohydrolase
MKLLIATRNSHKLEEIRALFAAAGLELASALDFPELPDVVEDGATLEANAVKKAVSLALATGWWSLADDSGLEVEALGGAPGVYSARYAGEPPDDQANNRKLLAALDGRTDRSARFRCVIALSTPEGRAQYVEGVCRGGIVTAPRGTAGFGYDPLFVPDGHQRTFAELTADEKNRISHRGRALAKAREQWSAILEA